MAEYLQVWQTKEVSIGLGFIDGCVVLERTRGNKKKRIRLRHECFPSLVQSVLHGLSTQPTEQLENRNIVGSVDGGFGELLVEWAPYFFGQCNALMIGRGTGNCIAIEQKNLLSFALWLTLHTVQLCGLGESQEVQ